MPHVTGHDGMEAGPADYSDFEYQHVNIDNTVEQPINNGNVRVAFGTDFDVLGGLGGLDSNEVAELVYSELQVTLEPEDEGGEQDTATSVETRGIFGANLQPGAGMVIDPDVSGFVTEETTPAIDPRGVDADSAFSDLTQNTEDGIFQHFQNRAVFPFQGDAGGNGGGAVEAPAVYEKNWRQLTNRGPVLDSNDNLTVNNVVVAGNTQIGFESNVRLHLVWDTATVNDAGRAFSVPSDD